MNRAIRVCKLTLLSLACVLACDRRKPEDNIDAALPPLEEVYGTEQAAVASAPEVPPPIARDHATRVMLDIEIKEHVKILADGVSYLYWSFGDESPGKFIRVREGDLVETHLSNHPDNALAHNIDFHGAIGPGGGGEASFIAPGHRATFTWRAMRPGLYLYHCVAAPAGLHIASGMYGLILVEPRQGLPKVDRELYITQGEFYTTGKYGEPGLQQFSMEKALREQPEYVVFNGAVGALMGPRALQVRVGERVRIYLGNAGPSLTSSFHIVGEIFEGVYGEGGIRINQRNVQTTVVPVGGSAMMEFTARVPGDYTLVDHSMFRAFNKGAMGMLRVTGPKNDLIFSGRTSESPYQSATHLERMARVEAPIGEHATKAELMASGARVFQTVCFACHQSEGQGLSGAFPPLAQSDFLMADKDRAIRILLGGLKGEIIVNGKPYNAEMPKPPISDEQVASVLTYVRNSFGNNGDEVTPADVARVKTEMAQGALPIKSAALMLRR
jgi:nitrite reductase (NO-forming)